MGTTASATDVSAVAPPHATTGLEDFRTGGWLVRSSLGTATRDDRVIHLRPQLVDLLLFLAKQEGRLATRKEILGAVWSGQFVAPTCLARCIAELRQALGDDAKSPYLIETVLKRGYRLCQPVEWLPDSRPLERWRCAPVPAGATGSEAAAPADPVRPLVPAVALAPSAMADPVATRCPPVGRPPEPDRLPGPSPRPRMAGTGGWWGRHVQSAVRRLSTDPLLALDRVMRRLSWRLAARS